MSTFKTVKKCTSKVKISKASLQWKIDNVHHTKQKDDFIYSAIFWDDAHDTSWRLQCFPRGVSHSEDGFMALYLWSLQDKTVKAQYTLSVIDTLGLNRKLVTDELNFTNYGRVSGSSDFLDLSSDVDYDYYVSYDGSLTVACELVVKGFIDTTEALVSDLRKLYTENIASDVSLDVRGESLKAHKSILSARSPVFKAMFESKMKEAADHESVKIDAIDVDTMRAVLEYIYTGDLPSVEKAMDVLPVADYYDLPELKVHCEDAISYLICAGNAAHILVLADLHRATALRKKTAIYINANRKKVKKTEDWKNLSDQQLANICQILMDY